MRQIIFFTLSWMLLTAFFWSDDEEKQLRTLHQSAELAIQKEDYSEAKEAYGALIDRVGVNSSQKYSVDWTTYVDMVIRYAESCEQIEEHEEGERALTKLLMRKPPDEFIPRIKLMRAKLQSSQQAPGEAFSEIQQIVSHIPKDELRKEDISFFHALEYALNTQYDQLLSKAKRYMVTGYFNQAIDLYEEILNAIESRHYPKALDKHSVIEKKVRYRLAESHYRLAHYEQTLALCYNPQAVEDRIDREMIYLSALCYREKNEYEKALACFQNYARSADCDDLDHFDHALFEIGLFYYQAGNFERACSYFEKLKNFDEKPALIAGLYQGRIHLKEGNPDAVEAVLSPISKKLPEDDPLLHECFYLRAEAAFACCDFERAARFFKEALPENRESCEWVTQALYHLSWCYIYLGEEENRSDAQRHLLFNHAEEILTRLLESREREASALALAKIYLLRWRHFDDPGSLTLIDSLLLPFHSPQALILRAEAAQGYQGKEMLLKEATDERFSTEPTYGDAWFERGLNHFQEGLKAPSDGSHYFALAAEAFAHSVRCLKQSERASPADILKLEAKANACRDAPISSIELLETLLTQFNESVEEREETLYLRGLIASRLEDHSYFSIAEESLLSVANGNGKFSSDALYVLGTLYFGQESYQKARDTFTSLATASPTSSLASEAWFWAAEAAENHGDGDHKRLRARVYWDYPDSNRAPEAFFRQYPYEDYLAGENKALAHLRAFPALFPHSPLLVVVHYLSGLNEERCEKAKASYEEAIKMFPLCLKEDARPDPAFIYFRYQAMLELAQIHLRDDVETAMPLLHEIVRDFSTPDHPLTTHLLKKEIYPLVYEEAEYALAKAFIKSGKKARAQEVISKILIHFDEAGISEGYFLSKVWQEQGKLAHECADFQTAITCFEIAEECGEGYLSGEQMLALWVSQSHAYRGKKEYDTSMRLLSKVINSDIPSPLRLRAMFYRAEIYELQGRPELAVRQLEAMSKKGGEWAMQAEEQLRYYGL